MTRDPAAVLAAALPVLEAVEQHIERVEDWATPAASRGPAASALPSYKAMRDAFYAFRASMEAGGPAGWRVGEDPTPDKP